MCTWHRNTKNWRRKKKKNGSTRTNNKNARPHICTVKILLKSNFVSFICNTITDFLSFEPNEGKKKHHNVSNSIFGRIVPRFYEIDSKRSKFSCKHRIIIKTSGVCRTNGKKQSNNNLFVVIIFLNRMEFLIFEFWLNFIVIAHLNFLIFHSHVFSLQLNGTNSLIYYTREKIQINVQIIN